MIGRRDAMVGTAAAALLAAGTARAAAGGFAGLPEAFARIEAGCGGRLGVAVLDTGGGARRAGHRQAERFPMCSTFKALLAGAVLARADAGRDRIDRRIRFGREELVPWSPVTQARTAGVGMTLAELCAATTAISDNTAANLLLRAIGGPEALTAWLRGIGDGVTRLDRYETELNEALPGDPRDTSTPEAMVASLRAMTLGPALSERGRATLLGWMRGNLTGGERLRAKLPPGWEAADRTGTGARGTSNVVGLLWPPGAAPLVVAAFLTGSPADDARREAALANVGAAVAAAAAAAG